ncbi:unnamed protein product [Adineta steineri]|uniref:Fucosyltransferase n=1 Tax=Adineta steineri TaxID=433720 RepID=A0A814P301_9BILA|nr:unnamed protein product [Adineta steineri]CAF1253203.1 unnamed protein product [Adineta steineri]
MAVQHRHNYCSVIKYFTTCMILSICALFYVSLTIENYALNYFNFSMIKYDDKLLFLNQSSLTYHMEQTEFYPHLPIQIYTKNREKFIKLRNKTKKIILLANGFFDDETWSMKSIKNKTNSGNMSELYCSFLNNQCEITNDRNRFTQADAVVYHMRNYINRSDEILKYRHPSQRFIFTSWESPRHSIDLRSYTNFFNWSMTYKFDSHIFASYYASDTYRSKDSQWFKNLPYNYEQKTVLYENINTTKKLGTVAALISNCLTPESQRTLLITELKKYVDVTVYGKCGKPCPNSIDCRTYIAERYYFFLSFENSYCEDYTTEKLFSTLALPIVPIVFGRVNYTRYIPQSAFINIQQFPSISKLSERLYQIRTNRTLYQEYFQWKKNFIWDRFLQFMSPFCDLCLRLHLDKTPNIIHNIHKWWYHEKCDPEVQN